MGIHDRVELQAEVEAPREAVFRLVATTDGLAQWADEAELEARVGGALRLRLRDAVGLGTLVALDPPQHISFAWRWEDEPAMEQTVLAFDAIAHGDRTHLTLRHVGLRDPRRRDLHEELWRHWFGRLVEAAGRRTDPAAPVGALADS
jgi:uncharacterized protein YndB with AHSA1/START domain